MCIDDCALGPEIRIQMIAVLRKRIGAQSVANSTTICRKRKTLSNSELSFDFSINFRESNVVE
jgi:hypothetical protein